MTLLLAARAVTILRVARYRLLGPSRRRIFGVRTQPGARTLRYKQPL